MGEGVRGGVEEEDGTNRDGDPVVWRNPGVLKGLRRRLSVERKM